MSRWYQKDKMRRIGLILMGLMMLGSSLVPLLQGRFFYSAAKGPAAGPVFAPIAILVGLFLAYLAVFRWDWLKKVGQGERPEKRLRR